MRVRLFNESDYDYVYSLWRSCNIELGTSDSREEILKFIEKNPETSLVGEVDGLIIGSILGGFDGRRGLIHHLAVDPSYQEKGYGRKLINSLEENFKRMGVVKISFWVKTNNIGVKDFYTKLGYKKRDDIITMSKVL